MDSQQWPSIFVTPARALLAATLLCSTCATTAAPINSARPPRSFGDAPPRTAPTQSSHSAPDPTVTDGDKYRVVLENEHVRVLRYRDNPGAKTRPHHHTEFVLYALAPFRRRLIFPDGTIKERDFKAGDVIWMPEQVHTGENVGTTDTDVVLVELKRR